MEPSIIISIIALVVSISTLGWKIYTDLIEHKPRLLVDHQFVEAIEHASGKRTPFIQVRITNIGRRTNFIERPLLCLSAGGAYFKRFEHFPYTEYPVRLEPNESFTTGIQLLAVEEDGLCHMRKGDALEMENNLVVMKEDTTLGGTVKEVPRAASISVLTLGYTLVRRDNFDIALEYDKLYAIHIMLRNVGLAFLLLGLAGGMKGLWAVSWWPELMICLFGLVTFYTTVRQSFKYSVMASMFLFESYTALKWDPTHG